MSLVAFAWTGYWYSQLFDLRTLPAWGWIIAGIPLLLTAVGCILDLGRWAALVRGAAAAALVGLGFLLFAWMFLVGAALMAVAAALAGEHL